MGLGQRPCLRTSDFGLKSCRHGIGAVVVALSGAFGLGYQSTRTRPDVMTGRQRSISEAMSLPNSSGVVGVAIAPSVFRRTFSASLPSASFTARLSLNTISRGVPAGATSPYH